VLNKAGGCATAKDFRRELAVFAAAVAVVRQSLNHHHFHARRPPRLNLLRIAVMVGPGPIEVARVAEHEPHVVHILPRCLVVASFDALAYGLQINGF
jgi:hypothetical protein